MLYVYKSKLLAENIDDKNYYKKLDNLIFASDFTVDVDNDGVPDLWKVSDSQMGYIQSRITEEFAEITNEGDGTSYMSTKQDISLKPQTSYTVKFEAGGNIPKDKIVFNIFSREGKNPQHQWKEIEFIPQLSEITTSFTTSEDLVEGKQWLRLNIQAAPEKHMILKTIEIWQK